MTHTEIIAKYQDEMKTLRDKKLRTPAEHRDYINWCSGVVYGLQIGADKRTAPRGK